LTLVGSEKADLVGKDISGDHSVRWGLFVNAKLSDLELSDLPGLGEVFLASWRKRKVTTPTQMLGEFVARGRVDFESFCAKEIGMRKVGANDNIYELSSALESKWNALSLFGSD
jgi:hypothetical protein